MVKLGTSIDSFYVLVLWLPARLGISLPQVGLILGALGWGAAAVAILCCWPGDGATGGGVGFGTARGF